MEISEITQFELINLNERVIYSPNYTDSIRWSLCAVASSARNDWKLIAMTIEFGHEIFRRINQNSLNRAMVYIH